MTDDYLHALQNAALFYLAGRGLIALAGRDAGSFLHNLCTNDIKALSPGSSCEAFLTTAKAKIVAHLFVNRRRTDGDHEFWLDMAPGQTERVSQHLGRYVISEDVEIVERSTEIAQMHLCGPQAEPVLEKVLSSSFSQLQELKDSPVHFGPEVNGIVRRHGYLGLPGFDIFCPALYGGSIRELLSGAGAVPASPDTYEVLRVEAGFPLFGPDMDEDRFVVEVGRGATAISYSKGCYLGQEPIVMARDRGHVNRTLLGLMIREGDPVQAGSRVLRGGEEVGRVTSSVHSPRLSNPVALAYLRRGSQEPGMAVEVETQEGPRPGEVSGLPLVVQRNAT